MPTCDNDGALNQAPGIEIEFNGRPLRALSGESLAAALLRHGVLAWRTTHKTGEPRGYFCGIGICQDCLVTIDGVPNLQACKTTVCPGMKVKSQSGLPLPEKQP